MLKCSIAFFWRWPETVTLYAIERTYPHRIDADPTMCPVCCGNKETDDRRFGTEIVRHLGEDHNRHPIFACLACSVWAEREVFAPVIGDRVRVSSHTGSSFAGKVTRIVGDRVSVTRGAIYVGAEPTTAVVHVSRLSPEVA